MNERAAQFVDLYRTYRIDDQLRFYQARREEFEKARNQAITGKGVLLAASGVLGVVGALVAGDMRIALAIVAAALAALATALAAYQSLYGFQEVAKLYNDAEVSLAALHDQGLDANLPQDEIRAHVARIEMVFRQENGQWGQLVQQLVPATPGDQPTSTPADGSKP